MKKYKIVDDSGVDYNFLRIHREDRWLGEIVEGSDEPLNGCITVKQPSGDGTWTAPVECFEEVKPEPCVTGPDEYLSKLDVAQDFVDHLRKRLGYGTTVTGGQLETLANVLDEAEVWVRSLWRKFNPLTAEEFAELHSLEQDYLNLVDPMGNQAENLFSAEKHFGVFDPDCSRPRWVVLPHLEVNLEVGKAEPSNVTKCTEVEFRKLLSSYGFSSGEIDQMVSGHIESGCKPLQVQHPGGFWDARWFQVQEFDPEDRPRLKRRKIYRRLEPVSREELRKALQKKHGFSRDDALVIIEDHLASGDETLDIWAKFNHSVTSYKVVK